MIKFTTTQNTDPAIWQALLQIDPGLPHIHIVDMPFRQASTWQDQGCQMGIWQEGDAVLAWAVFQPAWWNLDYAVHPAARGSDLEKDVLTWGKEEMLDYAARSGEAFYGSVELFESNPEAEKTISNLTSLGFTLFEWSTVRLEIALDGEIPAPQPPPGFRIRPFGGEAEVDDYVHLHRSAFGSEKMTKAWRRRTLAHPAYRPEIDLAAVNPQGALVGFCICWLRQDIGQIEPLGVHPEFQGLGLGRALERSAQQALQAQGARFVHLDHVSLNQKAISLSLQTGFRQKDNALRYFIDIKGIGK